MFKFHFSAISKYGADIAAAAHKCRRKFLDLQRHNNLYSQNERDRELNKERSSCCVLVSKNNAVALKLLLREAKAT